MTELPKSVARPKTRARRIRNRIDLLLIAVVFGVAVAGWLLELK
ncbi:hypothetical protein [Mycobacterium sp. 1274756.6]|nr:hypothetical protein [Mycobacterium sp. 1274756.6]